MHRTVLRALLILRLVLSRVYTRSVPLVASLVSYGTLLQCGLNQPQRIGQ